MRYALFPFPFQLFDFLLHIPYWLLSSVLRPLSFSPTAYPMRLPPSYFWFLISDLCPLSSVALRLCVRKIDCANSVSDITQNSLELKWVKGCFHALFELSPHNCQTALSSRSCLYTYARPPFWIMLFLPLKRSISGLNKGLFMVDP